jgi:hypothetical protein
MKQVKELGTPLGVSAAKSGMHRNTARKYIRGGTPPSESKLVHDWRTRKDPFIGVFDELAGYLKSEPGLQASTLFDYIQRQYPGQFSDGQIRSLQRRVKFWRATQGEGKEVFFAQEHHPGDQGQSDFCHLTRLGVTIAHQSFPHLIYHFVLTYSNWEFVRICFSESFESLSEGLQEALWTLGGVPRKHRTDCLSAAVNNLGNTEEFTQRYEAIGRHYGTELVHIQPKHPNEDGDVEQSHNRFIERIDQALMLRGSREFLSRAEYQQFLFKHVALANQARSDRFALEKAALQPLPAQRLDCCRRLKARVGQGSTVSLLNNIYSVPSRLMGERVDAAVRSEHIDLLLGNQVVHTLPRLRGRGGKQIDYRHIIDWLVRKPGAFEQYIHRDALFPSSHFRMAYDVLTTARPVEGKKDYLRLLKLAADEGQARVESVLRSLLETPHTWSINDIADLVAAQNMPSPPADVRIAPVDLSAYDSLLASPLECGAATDDRSEQEVRHA